MTNPENFGHKSDLLMKTPNGIKLFRLASIKSRIKLEATGIKFSGGSTRSKVAAEFGLKPRDSHEKFINKIQEQIDSTKLAILKENLVIDNVTPDLVRVIALDRAALITREPEGWWVSFASTVKAEQGQREKELTHNADDALAAAKSWVLEVR